MITKIKFFIILLFLIVSFLFPKDIFAISGACSHHGGVDCAMGRQPNGKVYCNDGWTGSMVEYDFMVECQRKKYFCTLEEWEQLYKKYELDDLYSKMGDVIEEITDNPLAFDLYNVLLKQFNMGLSFVEEECEAIGMDRFNQQTYEMMKLQSEWEELEELEEQKRQKENRLQQLQIKELEIKKNYLKSLEKLQKSPQNICSTNSTFDGVKCVCNEGYIMRNNKCITYTEVCIQHFGQNVYGIKSDEGVKCVCKAGYEWNMSQTACIKKITCPTNSIKMGNSCICKEGYVRRDNKCITYTEVCKRDYKNNVYGQLYNGKVFCHCEQGYEWNSSNTACIKSIVCPPNSSKIAGKCVCNDGYTWDSSKKVCVEKVEEKISLIEEKQYFQAEEETLKKEPSQLEEKRSEGEELEFKEQKPEQKQEKSLLASVSSFVTSIFNDVKNFLYRFF